MSLQNSFSLLLFCVLSTGNFILAFDVLDESNDENSVQSHREERFLIPTVRLRNDACQVNNENGTCYLRSQCFQRGGQPIGTCSEGLGTCCKFTLGCSNTSSYRTISERSFLLKDDRNCNYEFTKLDGYCQMKLDFTSLYNSPNRNGSCADGSMTVKESATVSGFPLCGVVKRPIYLSYGQGNRIELNFERGGDDSKGNYEVKITQIRCDSRDRIPDHCLQEYDTKKGQVENFGYSDGGGGWISGQEYSICVKDSGTSGKIVWNTCEESGKLATLAAPIVAGSPIPIKSFVMTKLFGVYGSYGDNCDQGLSYVSIPGNKFCGAYFPREGATSSSKPYILSVKLIEDTQAQIRSIISLWPSLRGINGAAPEGTCENLGATAPYATMFMGQLTAVGGPGGATPVPPHYQCIALKPPTELMREPVSTLKDLVKGFCLTYELLR